MSNYERLPTTPNGISPSSSRSSSPDYTSPTANSFPPRSARAAAQNRELQRQTAQDPRFNVPTPSWWKRAALLLFMVFLFWASMKLRGSARRVEASKVVYANRYSKDYKFRPAASPVVTERLKDGRIRLRGAHVGHDL